MTTEAAPLSAAGNPIGFGRMQRKEDVRFVRGEGNYVDDVNLPGMLHSAILRSPYAHAKINSVDTSAAEADGVARGAEGDGLLGGGHAVTSLSAGWCAAQWTAATMFL